MMSELVWRKSTRSQRYNCVEVAVTSEFAAVRDSKDRGGGHFAVSRPQWQTFLSALRADHYDR